MKTAHVEAIPGADVVITCNAKDATIVTSVSSVDCLSFYS